MTGSHIGAKSAQHFQLSLLMLTQFEASKQTNQIMFSYEMFHCPSRTVLLNLLVPLVLLLNLVSCEHRVTVYRRGHLASLYRPSCTIRNDCPDNSFCHNSQKKCVCKQDYIEVQKFVNHSYVSHQKMTCLPIARLDDRCVSTDQVCINSNYTLYVPFFRGWGSCGLIE